MQFEDEVVGGTVLIRPAIQSPNYVAGSAGWSINQDGSAEFFDLVVRGDGTGDVVIVGPDDGPQVILGSQPTAGYIVFPTNRPIEVDVARLASFVENEGLANEYASLEMQGPSITGGDRLTLQLNSARADGSFQPVLQLFDVATQDGIFSASKDLIQLQEFTQITPGVASATSSVLYMNAAAGHTFNLFRAQLDSVDMFTVDESGTLSTYAANGFSTYTPVVSNGGTATFTTRTGWYQRIGKMIFFCAYVKVNAAGSGASTVTITAPTSVNRSIRQSFTCHTQSTTTAGAVMNGHAVALDTGTGATIDRISVSNDGATNRDNILQGVNLLANAEITITGWYREA